MQPGQAVRRMSAWVRAKWAGFGLPAPSGTLSWPTGRQWRQIGLAAVALLAAYYILGALLMETIDDDPSFAAQDGDLLAGESRAIANAVALLDREINEHGWVGNDPIFLPTAFLGDMASYQKGIVDGIARFAKAVAANLAAAKATDSNLSSAIERLSRPGTVWLWDLSKPLAFLGRSEDQYREGLVALQSYNVGVSSGDSPFPRTPDAVRALLLAAVADLDEGIASLGTAAEAHAALFSAGAVHEFYFVKGRAYAQLVLLNGLARDAVEIFGAENLKGDWAAARDALRAAATFGPAFVVNGAPDGAFLPSHLVAEGYYLARARGALNRLASKLG